LASKKQERLMVEIQTKKVLTLCIPHQGDRVLLAMKKRGFGEGRWNGFGGKVEEGETIEQAAIRETKEEGMINVTQMKELGVVEFSWQNRADILEVHIFKATEFVGEPGETEEMRPQWFGVSEIPFAQMWSDDIHWFNYFLADRPFRARFRFDEADQVVEHEVLELERA
jgi:NADH pyrophosphatase NudC (nudix superfamily)